jgi:dTDP-4-dehydrorhamnose reductase
MRILITGRNGQLGWALARHAAPLGEIIAVGRDELDLSRPDTLADTVVTLRPDVVFNAAAYTAVDRAEQDRDTAFRVNAESPAVLARACAGIGAAFVHYSTDYVFDGSKPTPYVEDDPTGPLNVYGASKLEGERGVLDAGGAAIVLRTSWVYGDHGGNFAKTMLRLAGERDALRVVGDQHGTPTWAGRLADLSVDIVRQASSSGDLPGWLGTRRGVYHASAAGATTWAGYARHVIETASAQAALAPALRTHPDRIEAIPSSAYPTPAARPLNSLLDGSALQRAFGYRMPDWKVDVTDFVKRLAAAHATA